MFVLLKFLITKSDDPIDKTPRKFNMKSMFNYPYEEPSIFLITNMPITVEDLQKITNKEKYKSLFTTRREFNHLIDYLIQKYKKNNNNKLPPARANEAAIKTNVNLLKDIFFPLKTKIKIDDVDYIINGSKNDPNPNNSASDYEIYVQENDLRRENAMIDIKTPNVYEKNIELDLSKVEFKDLSCKDKEQNLISMAEDIFDIKINEPLAQPTSKIFKRSKFDVINKTKKQIEKEKEDEKIQKELKDKKQKEELELEYEIRKQKAARILEEEKKKEEKNKLRPSTGGNKFSKKKRNYRNNQKIKKSRKLIRRKKSRKLIKSRKTRN
jgi:hypothetical protein